MFCVDGVSSIGDPGFLHCFHQTSIGVSLVMGPGVQGMFGRPHLSEQTSFHSYPWG